MSFTFSKLLTHTILTILHHRQKLVFYPSFPLWAMKLKLQLVVHIMIYRVSQKKLRTELCWSHSAQALKRSQVISMGKFGFTALNFGWGLFPLVTLFWDTLCICLISKATERERGGQVLVSWAHPDESELEEDATLSVDLLCPDFLTSSWELNLSEGELACCAPCERVWPWGAHD